MAEHVPTARVIRRAIYNSRRINRDPAPFLISPAEADVPPQGLRYTPEQYAESAEEGYAGGIIFALAEYAPRRMYDNRPNPILQSLRENYATGHWSLQALATWMLEDLDQMRRLDWKPLGNISPVSVPVEGKLVRVKRAEANHALRVLLRISKLPRPKR